MGIFEIEDLSSKFLDRLNKIVFFDTKIERSRTYRSRLHKGIKAIVACLRKCFFLRLDRFMKTSPLILLFLFFTAIGWAEIRPWTDKNGNTVKAEIIAAYGSSAFLKTRIKLPFRSPSKSLGERILQISLNGPKQSNPSSVTEAYSPMQPATSLFFSPRI